MALTPIGPPHNIGNVFHTQILQDKSVNDATKAFFAEVTGPNGLQKQVPLNNSTSMDIPISGIPGFPLAPNLHVEVDNFMLLPAGSTPTTAHSLSCLVVFKVKELFSLTIGSVPVSASLS